MEEIRHVPSGEGDQTWLHHLGRPQVVKRREAWIVEFVRGKSVAHLGFADTGCELTRSRTGSWLHAQLAESSRLVGIDITPAAVEAARSRGYAAYVADCTSVSEIRALGLDPVEVVLAGEIIEHVDNPGGLLEAAKALLHPGGVLVLTTPNARCLTDVIVAGANREVIHPDHVALYSQRTLSALLNRYAWEVAETLVYMNPRSREIPVSVKVAAMRFAAEVQRALVATVAPYLADGLIVVAERSRDS